jgi:Fe-S cluster assembly ATP-binding protein
MTPLLPLFFMLSIKNLRVSVEEKPIIHGISLKIKPGEIHVVMGPNGSGKSTLANTIMGHPKYSVRDGEIRMNGENVVGLKADKRAQRGIFLAFQYPKEIPGVTVISFLQMAVAAVRKARGEPVLNPIEFRKLLRRWLAEFSLDAKFMNRYVNEGFSGGEKKKMEILQMALLEPKIAVLDETDSGLDVDALKMVAEGINRLASPQRGILLITHYQRILHYVKPHFVHVMMEGKIVKSGGPELAGQLENEGYKTIL